MGFFSNLFKREAKDHAYSKELVVKSSEIVTDYCKFMTSSTFPDSGNVTDIKNLPFNKGTLKLALEVCLVTNRDDPNKALLVESMKHAYLSLAEFQKNVGEKNIGLKTMDLRKTRGIDLPEAVDLAEPNSERTKHFIEAVRAERKELLAELGVLLKQQQIFSEEIDEIYRQTYCDNEM